ncbi:MAG: ion channel [Microcystaceae cyanobacterium]
MLKLRSPRKNSTPQDSCFSTGRSKGSNRFFPFLRNKNPVALFHPATHDLYHWLLALRWRYFLILISLFYFSINCLFAFAYMTAQDGIANAESGSFKDAFFFSIQTLSTVGYGSMYPQSLYAQILVTVEIWLGLLLLTILTGLMFARFSRPTAKVLFSNVAVICPYNGTPTLMLRTANRRDNRILEAQVKLCFILNETSEEGHQLRRFYELELLRSQTPVFDLSWLIMHPIDQNSPLYGETIESLEEKEGEIGVMLTGLDETFSQTIHARYVYTPTHILHNQRFVDIFSRNAQGKTYIDLAHFHDVVPIFINC